MAAGRYSVQEPDGNLVIGTRTTIFRMTTSGSLTTLRTLNSWEGIQIHSGLRSPDGRIYTLALIGGVTDRGTLLSLTPAGAVAGLNPFVVDDAPNTASGSLIAGEDGSLYGVSCRGGLLNAGTIFRFTPAGVMTTLHSFLLADGSCPLSMLRGVDGNFYGVTLRGGIADVGTIFV